MPAHGPHPSLERRWSEAVSGAWGPGQVASAQCRGLSSPGLEPVTSLAPE